MKKLHPIQSPWNCVQGATLACWSAIFLVPAAFTLADDRDGSLLLEPVDVSQIHPLDLGQLTTQIQKLSKSAQLFERVGNRLDDAFDGSPRQANFIALVKLKQLEQVTTALPISAGAIENFRASTLLTRARNASENAVIRTQLADMQRELQQLASRVQIIDGEPTAPDDSLVRMAKKLERMEDLEQDLRAIQTAQGSVDLTLKNLATLERGIQTFAAMTEDEVHRQSEAIRRNRLARQSVTLQAEALHLYAAMQSLAPSIAAFEQNSTRPLVPEMVAAELPTALLPQTITAEMKAKIMRQVQTSRDPSRSSAQTKAVPITNATLIHPGQNDVK